MKESNEAKLKIQKNSEKQKQTNKTKVQTRFYYNFWTENK